MNSVAGLADNAWSAFEWIMGKADVGGVRQAAASDSAWPCGPRLQQPRAAIWLRKCEIESRALALHCLLR